MFDSSILAQYGVTNLIDIDGLLYAPVSDLWRFYQEYHVDRLALAATFLVSVVAIGWAVNVIADFVVQLIRRKKSESKGGFNG